MRKSAEFSLGFGVACGVLVCGLALAGRAAAEEPKCLCPQAAGNEVGVPIMSKIPYISRLFKNVGVARASHCVDGKCPAEANETIERIGIELELCADENTAVCRACPVTGRCQVAARTACACPGECCPEGKCACSQPASKETALWEKIVELAAGQAAAEAALEVQSESLERSAELLEALAETHAEKAKLEARLEALAETNKITEQLLELAAENTRLKAQVELAEAKAEVMRATVEMTVENERLKMRVADLEVGATDKATRTAARPRAEKKPR